MFSFLFFLQDFTCPCCSLFSSSLGTYLSHQCQCSFNVCRLLDVFPSQPSTHQPLTYQPSTHQPSTLQSSDYQPSSPQPSDHQTLSQQIAELFADIPEFTDVPTLTDLPELVDMSIDDEQTLAGIPTSVIKTVGIPVSVIQYGGSNDKGGSLRPQLDGVSELVKDKPTTIIEKMPPSPIYIDLVSPINNEQDEALDLTVNHQQSVNIDPPLVRTSTKRIKPPKVLSAKKKKMNSLSLLSSQNKFELMSSALENTFTVYRCVLSSVYDIHTLIQVMMQEILRVLVMELNIKKILKFHFCIHIIFEKDSEDGVLRKTDYLWTKLKPLMQSDDILSIVTDTLLAFESQIDEYSQRGSGWRMIKVEIIELRIVKFRPMKGGCLDNPLPLQLVKKTKSLRTVKCTTDCFMYSVLAALHPMDHADRPSRYEPFLDFYDFSMARGLVSLHQIKKFEEKNNISINVYTFDDDDKVVIPLKIVEENLSKHVNLCLYNDHFHTITRFESFVRGKNHNRCCPRCLFHFRDQIKLDSHLEFCKKIDPQRVSMPGGDFLFVSRNRFDKESKHPFIIYADFETFSLPTSNETGELKQNEPCSFGLVVVNWKQQVIHSNFYRGDNPAFTFLQSLNNLTEFLDQYLKDHSFPVLNMTPSDEIAMRNSKYCHICLNPLKGITVRDHDHLTGKFRGAAHQECNINYQVPKYIPVVFHNLKNFDGHIIINSLKSGMFKNPPQIIAQTIERYVGFVLDRFKFIDSLAFLPSSLDNLSSDLSDAKKIHFLNQLFPGDVSLLLKKGALPYEYLDSHERFNESELPPLELFHSSLTDSTISESCYESLKRVWDKFQCKTLGDFHDIYLKVDVLLLAAVFENFRQTSIEFFNIDPPHHWSAPGLTWAAALKTTCIKLTLLADLDMLMMIEKGIRGGLTMVSKRHVIANNPEVPNYNPAKPKTHILYLDVNNLYGFAMIQRLPVRGFRWIDVDSSDTLLSDILSTPDDGDHGFFVEVDLEYPSDLHDAHNDYPLAPERREITRDALSDYQKILLEKLESQGIKYKPTPKLMTTFFKKEKMVLHYRTLKFYKEKGMVITKLHRVIAFRQEVWLKPYVDFCTSQRQLATNTADSNFWKLNVNALYGKTIENVRNHLNVVAVDTPSRANFQVRKELCERFLILNDNLALVQVKKGHVFMNKPISVGFSILELAKLQMYKLHYDTFKAYFNDKIQLIYTDTDSLIYEIETNDLSTDLSNLSDVMDFSNYDKSDPLYSSSNHRKIGYLKDEMGGKPIHEFIGIKPKLYAFKTDDGIKKVAKGVQRSTLKKKIDFDDYKNCLFNEIVNREDVTRLGSRNHQISLIKQNKIALSPLDDKRFLLNDKINSLAYGHFRSQS